MAWYKQKFPEEKYYRKGDPQLITEDSVAEIEGWVPPTEEECSLWEDAKSVIEQKKKKSDFRIEYKDKPQQTSFNMFKMEIKVLHTDYRGFIYSAEGEAISPLEKKFWPVVVKLLAHYCSPKLKKNHISEMLLM